MPKISELNEITSLYANDYFAVAHDINGLPSTKRITVNNLADNLVLYANYANTISPGVVLVGNNLSVNATGYIYASFASNTQAGVILVGNNLTINATGYLSATGSGSGYTGSVGYVGSQGQPGGYTGSMGSTGYSGSLGSLGYTGSIGFTGSVGPSANFFIANGSSWSPSGNYNQNTVVSFSNSTFNGYFFWIQSTPGNSVTAPPTDATRWGIVASRGSIGYTGSSGASGTLLSTTAQNIIGPYTNDTTAAAGGVVVNGLYYDSSGIVHIRLT